MGRHQCDRMNANLFPSCLWSQFSLLPERISVFAEEEISTSLLVLEHKILRKEKSTEC